MATLTKAQLADRVLSALGVLGAGQSASAEDSNAAQEAIDGVHDRLNKDRLVSFETSAIPEWAQDPLRDIAAATLLTTFGVGGERAQSVREGARVGRIELASQLQVKIHPVPVRAKYY